MRFLVFPMLVIGSGCGGSGTTVNGQGATFVEPIVKTWANAYLEPTHDLVRINYQGSGSGAGIAQMTRRTADFGCTDVPLSRSQIDDAAAVGGAVVHIPLVVGAVVPVYHLPGTTAPLTFSGETLADIFRGRTTRWNDPALQRLNPGAALPDLAIQPVFRAEPSGTSFLFSQYLAKHSAGFRATVGASTLPNWPEHVGIKQGKTDGVAGHITRTPGAIGYVELTYALDTKATFGLVVNRAGRAVRADLASITAAAAAGIDGPAAGEPYSLHELTFDLTDAAGETSYPIAGMSYAVLYQKQHGPKGRALIDFLTWATSEPGQTLARQRNYAPLSAVLRPRIAALLAAMAATP